MKRQAGVVTVSTGSPSQIEHFGWCFRPSIEINAIAHRIGTVRRGCQGSKPPNSYGREDCPCAILINLRQGWAGWAYDRRIWLERLWSGGGWPPGRDLLFVLSQGEKPPAPPKKTLR